MSTDIDARVEADPFRYGWRYVNRELPDGRIETETVPLTLDDLLFPQEGDHAMQTHEHSSICRQLATIFEARLADVPGALVLFDCRVNYDVPGVEPVGPDLSIFLDVVGFVPQAGTFDLAEIDGRPALVVEVTSLDTRPNDFGIKKEIYHRAGVAVYVIIDPASAGKRRPMSLSGFRDTPDGYEPILLDEQGRLHLELMNLRLAIIDDEVVCTDGLTGERIGDYLEQVQSRREAEARFEAERARADTLEARLRAMEEENRKLRGG